MASSNSSALHSAALVAGGAVVGTSLFTLARSLMSGKALTKVSSAPSSGKSAAAGALAGATSASSHPLRATTLQPSEDAVDDKSGLFVAPKSTVDATYNTCGVMGVPYSPRSKQPLVKSKDTHVDLGFGEAVPATSVDMLTLDQAVLATSLLAIEALAFANSGTIFTYESATTGFGQACEAQAQEPSAPRVLAMQTRAGAGQAIAGYLAGEGSADQPAGQQATVSVLTNAQGLLAMGPALATIDTKNTDLVLHVSGASQATSDDLSVTNDYASTLSTAAMLGDLGFEVLISSTRQEAVEVAHYAYTRKDKKPLIHIFDGAFAGAEVGTVTPPSGATPEALAYTGPSSPETVLVMPNGSISARARAMLLMLPSATRSKLGIIAVRALRPWDGKALCAKIPSGAKTVRVVEEAFSPLGGALYADVLEASLSGACGEKTLAVQSVVLAPGQELSVPDWYALLQAAVSSSRSLCLSEVLAKSDATQVASIDLLKLTGSHLYTFFGTDEGCTSTAAPLLASALHDNRTQGVRALSRFDNFAAGGAVRADVVYSERQGAEIPIDMLAREGQSNVVIVSEPVTLLRRHAVLSALRENGTVVFLANGWTPEDVDASLCADDKKLLAAKKARVFVVDPQASVQSLTSTLADAHKGKNEAPSATDLAPSVLLASVAQAESSLASLVSKASWASDKVWQNVMHDAVKTVPVPDTWAAAESATPEEAEKAAKRATQWSYNSTRAHTDMLASTKEVQRASWAMAAWQLLFREAYASDEHALRPDLPEKTYNIKVSVNKRLTPLEYDRYLFHMELDTTGTDLKYEVGEALGVHGWNDDEEVAQFIAWSGYNPDEVVFAPSVLCPGTMESRTVFQTLQQNLDIFGKPPKSFFEALGKAVKSKDEARWLRFISSAEGSSTFKKLSESETVTYVDVLHMFPSAQVDMNWLIKHVEPIKPRHYSIASAQVAVGNSVHLLIVTVDWKTPHGSPRYGQCTRYLSRLRPGTKVTVSLKPSVMKLPPLSTQPIIMAGLGTGAAPFRAFLQYRAYEKAQGKEIGPMYYYFGSRHRAMEYMYGEELEAYLADGVLTHLGLAFSRDQKKKVYIQHKIVEDGKQLTEYLVPELAKENQGKDLEGMKGLFTLCGPVWPVPDIQEALVTAFIEHGWSREQAEEKINELKEEERYVLEVY